MHVGPEHARSNRSTSSDDRLTLYGLQNTQERANNVTRAQPPVDKETDTGSRNINFRRRLLASNPDPSRGSLESDVKICRRHSGRERLTCSAPGNAPFPYSSSEEEFQFREVTPEHVTSPGEYDSDDALSDDLDDDTDSVTPEVEISTRVYLKACGDLGIIPVTFFSQHLQEQELVMRHYLLGPKGAKACAISLVFNTTVQTLDLTGNDIRDKGAEYVSQMLTENLYISSLTLAENGITSAGLRTLCGVLMTNKTIRQLDISENRFIEKDSYYVAQLLKENTTLQELYLRHNGFRELGGEVLAVALGKNHHLEVLDLSWNHLRRKGAVAISEALERNASLRVLRVAWNGWYLDGCKALGKALATNNTLTELDITCNRINKDCIMALLNNLKRNTQLQRISLGHNPITADGAKALLFALRECPSMKLNYINIANQSVDQVFIEFLDELRESRPLEVVHGVVFQHDDISQVVDALLDEDPMMVLMEFMRQRNMRLVDLFSSLDTDGSKSLTRDEFRDGLMIQTLFCQSVNIPLSAAAFDKLMKKLDQDGDGEVDFSELLDGQREYKKKLMRLQKRQVGNPEDESEIQRISTKIQRILAAKKAAEKKGTTGKIKAAAMALMVVNNVGTGGTLGDKLRSAARMALAGASAVGPGASALGDPASP